MPTWTHIIVCNGVIYISNSYFWHIFLQCFFSVCKDVDKSEEQAMFDILCVLEMVGAVKANKQFSIHLFALYGHHGLNVNVSNTPLFAWSMVQTRQNWPVVNVKIGWHWHVEVVRPQCKRIQWILSTFISSITRLSRLAKSPFQVALDDLRMMIMTEIKTFGYMGLYAGLHFLSVGCRSLLRHFSLSRSSERYLKEHLMLKLLAAGKNVKST